jgi:putative tricarboxylic transport membrane protein
MDTFTALGQGFVVALAPAKLLYALVGVFLGTAVGVLPGIGPALTVALLLPVTFKLDPTGSLIMFAGIYYGGMYGGSTTSILINTPGESASMITALEGNRMAKAGRGGPALATGRHRLVRRRHDRDHRARVLLAVARAARHRVRARRLLRPHGRRLRHRVGDFGDSPLRGLTSLFVGLFSGSSASTASPARRG